MTISSQTRKAGPYTGNGSTTTFPFAFKVFVNTDVLVVRTDLSGVETVLTLGTDYTVSLNADQNSNAGGNVVMGTALTSGFLLTLGSKVPLLQQTDFTNQGGFYPAVINASLDRLTILTQQINEEVGRSAKLPISSQADADTLSAAILLLSNDQANIDAVAGDLANIDAVATDLTNIDTVATNIANVNAVGGNIANVNAVAGNATNINAVKNNATNINTVAGINANVTTVAGISANVTTVAGISSNVTSVAGNATNINAVAGNATNINAVNANKTNIDAVAGNATNINAVNSNAANINTAATNIAAIIDAPNQATAAAASAAAAAASAASGMYSAVQDKSASYTVVAADAGDLIRVTTTSGARTITLPTIGSTGIGDGFKVAIVKWTGDANAVTIARSGSDTINGATSYTLGNQYSSCTFVADLETNTWFAAASGLGTSNVNVDVFSGSGGTAFTLSGDAGAKNNTLVTIGGVYQAKSTYSLSGTTLTFSAAPPTGTSNIEVVWTSPLAIGTPSDDTVSTAKLQAGAVTPAKLSTGAPTWDTSGNVGIGTSSPSASLSVTKQTTALSGTGNSYGLYAYPTSSGLTYIDAITGSTGDTSLGLRTYNNGTYNEVRIDSSGNLLVGLSTSVAGKVQIKNNSGDASTGLNVVESGTNNYWSQYIYTVTHDMYLSYNNANKGYFQSSTGAYVATSDQRLKKNISDIEYGLSSVLALRPTSYHMTEQEDSDAKNLGFIAQEAMQVVPEVVFEMKDGMYGMDKSAIVPVLVKAIQEQQALITSLTARIAALEAN